MRVACQATSADFGAELVQLTCVQPALDESAGIDARRGVALEVDLVTGCGVRLASEEVIEADFVKRSGALDRWPPIPGSRMFARVTITAAFQRM
jgi:hypothetical protein